MSADNKAPNWANTTPVTIIATPTRRYTLRRRQCGTTPDMAPKKYWAAEIPVAASQRTLPK